MPKRGKPCCECTPLHITRWENIYVEHGVLYAVFRSGGSQHAVSMGPGVALEAIELARRALMGGDVIPLLKKAPAAH